MRFKKRHFILFILAILPFSELIHTKDYCFGDANLLLFALLSIPFVVVFLTLIFYNVYTITLRVELFNFIPLLIAGLFFTTLFLGLEYHDKNPFKNKVQVFNAIIDANTTAEIILFDDKTFELKTTIKDVSCYKKGIYNYKKDSLFLNKFSNVEKDTIFDTIYKVNEMHHSLEPVKILLPEFILKK